MATGAPHLPGRRITTRCSGRSRRKRWSFAADLGVMPTDVTHGWVGVERLETARKAVEGLIKGCAAFAGVTALEAVDGSMRALVVP